MKALIVSDTHGMDKNLYEVIKRVAPFDLLIHAGDLQGSERDIENAVLGCAVKMVTGNNDYGSYLHSVEEFEFDGEIILTDPLGIDERLYGIIKDRISQNL